MTPQLYRLPSSMGHEVWVPSLTHPSLYTEVIRLIKFNQFGDCSPKRNSPLLCHTCARTVDVDFARQTLLRWVHFAEMRALAFGNPWAIENQNETNGAKLWGLGGKWFPNRSANVIN